MRVRKTIFFMFSLRIGDVKKKKKFKSSNKLADINNYTAPKRARVCIYYIVWCLLTAGHVRVMRKRPFFFFLSFITFWALLPPPRRKGAASYEKTVRLSICNTLFITTVHSHILYYLILIFPRTRHSESRKRALRTLSRFCLPMSSSAHTHTHTVCV